MTKDHTFHIPVMGTCFTIDSPLKVAHFGIDSVVSLVDDVLIERIRKRYSQLLGRPYTEISDKEEDYRAQRITSYLDMIYEESYRKYEELKEHFLAKRDDFLDYLSNFPDSSELSRKFNAFKEKLSQPGELKNWIHQHLPYGSIDVNIMTKLDKTNYRNGEELPQEYNDAHAALRGFAKSKLRSSLVLSAGMNPHLYSYISKFEDFFPNALGEFKKKITLKVSDFKSALIQAKFLAKKGLWVSEFRIESGLNCGGHAFAKEGHLMGPILEEFKRRKRELKETVQDILFSALRKEVRVLPQENLEIRLSAQGGVGTAAEHQLLVNEYGMDSVGWGTPFLLVPEASTVDDVTMESLKKAGVEDLYLSGISPLGVPFNNLRNNTQDAIRNERIAQGDPGSSCPLKFLRLSTELTEKPLCTASKAFQKMKIEKLKLQELEEEAYQKAYDAIVERSCICTGLGTAAYHLYDIPHPVKEAGVSICPGPNLAYFTKEVSLRGMMQSIYGKAPDLVVKDRPHFFIKELEANVLFLANKMRRLDICTKRERKDLMTFASNIGEGISYYQRFFNHLSNLCTSAKEKAAVALEKYALQIQQMKEEIS